jgi:DNA invertase Pin-like site-specific DNA recombinase
LLAQRDAVKRAASVKYKESEIEEVYGKESAIKLKEEERQTLKEMKELIVEYPTIETIFFFAVDRLARRMSIVLSIAEWAKDEKINLVFYTLTQ